MNKKLVKAFSLLLILIIVASTTGCGRDRSKLNNNNKNIINSAKDGILDVAFAIEVIDEQGVAKVLTNLPKDTKVTVLLRNKNTNESTTAQVTEIDNKNYIITSPLTNDGKTLKNGSYRLKITMEKPSLQPDSVKKIIGDKGQMLSGISVFEQDNEVFAMETIKVDVKKGVFYKSR